MKHLRIFEEYIDVFKIKININKIEKTIKSCKTLEQLDNSINYIFNYKAKLKKEKTYNNDIDIMFFDLMNLAHDKRIEIIKLNSLGSNI